MWSNRKKLCIKPWSEVLIREDGKVYFCCHSECIGDLNTQTFDEIWNSDIVKEARIDINRGVFPKVCVSVSCPVRPKK